MDTASKLPAMSTLGVIFLTWRRCLQKRLLPFGITLKQLYVLRRLEKRESLSPSNIAEILFCDRPTATSILHTMTRNGWIESRKDPINRKRRQISLTAVGKEKLVSLAGFALEPDFDPLGCFVEKERKQFEELLQKLYRHMKTLPDE
jgi:DNA-binding MarR family transcriptional regulator